MKWATTVVVAPVRRGREVLAESLQKFPAQFLLFSQQVERLGLEDRGASGAARSITLTRDDQGPWCSTTRVGGRCGWCGPSGTSPSKAALADGGYSAARESVEVAWAAPLEGAPKGVGTFWAYFPTSSGTTLSGIVNAPWKLADDRESLLPGPFNDEILTTVLPKLVGEALSSLHRPDRPTADSRRAASAWKGSPKPRGRRAQRPGDAGGVGTPVHSHTRRRAPPPDPSAASSRRADAGRARLVGLSMPRPRQLDKPRRHER